MRFRLLGGLQVWNGAAWLPIAAGQQRVVLTVLLAEAGRVVSTDRLVDEVWGEHAPRTAVVTVQGYVRRLRRLLGAGRDGPLVTRGHGYQLMVLDDDLDADVFARLVDAGRRSLAAGDLHAAAAGLSEALALWHGPALADVAPAPTVAALAARLEQSRLDALEQRVDALLGLGSHVEALGELGRLVDEHPLRERLQAQHMLALYRCGRRSEALSAYRRAREVLVAELGVEPGPELRCLQKAILDDDQDLIDPVQLGARVVHRVPPAQLPADVTGFTGRDAYLCRLDALLAAHPAMAVGAVDGAAGVGKTALVVHWAHRMRARFPDGQLHADLRGFAAARPLAPIDVLSGFLHALGVPGGEIPADIDAAAALYRSLLAGKRVLVLLDNAADPNQVRPLLPGDRECVTLVTSRMRMDGLVARDGATRINLDILDPVEATALLTGVLGPERAVESGQLPALAALCGNLPLALRIAAADLAAHPAWTVAEYRERLRRDQLGTLEIDGDPDTGVRAAIARSYTALSAEARRLFRRLGLASGRDVSHHAAAALANTDPATTASLLDRLTATHLIEEHGTGQYTFHDLLRLFAKERAREEDVPRRQPADPDRNDRRYKRFVNSRKRKSVLDRGGGTGSGSP